ncbi:MAG: hypothetical protein KDJ52_22650 [Anaerolineae bacterium]|nr:hypothetical protein [Anaerolineae bacterium]
MTWPRHDFHIHTRPHSPDAHWRATLPAMLKRAAKNGVTTVGLANHYFLDTNFTIFQKLPAEVSRKAPDGMTVWVGAELCVLDTTGRIKLTEEEAQQLDFVLAGPHQISNSAGSSRRRAAMPPHLSPISIRCCSARPVSRWLMGWRIRG